MNSPGQPLTNTQKVAMFLYALGPERSARILEHLEPDHVARIAREIAVMGKVPNHAKRAVLREFRALVQADDERREGLTFAQEMLDRAVGPRQAQAVLQRITPPTPGPCYLSTVTPARAAELLATEPVAIIAMLLVALPAERVGAILSALPTDLQPEVALRLTATTPPSPEVRANLERAVRAKAARHRAEEVSRGEAAMQELGVAEVAWAEGTEPLVSDDSAEALTFHALNGVDRRTLRAALRFAATADLCHALRGADPVLREHLLSALPHVQRMTVQRRLQVQQALPVRCITEAQGRILALVTAGLRERQGVGEPVHV